MNFPEDVPNSSQSFMSLVDQVYNFFKTCTYSLFTYTISTKLFVPPVISIFPIFLKSKLDLNIQAATPNSCLLACAFFPVFLLLGENKIGHF